MCLFFNDAIANFSHIQLIIWTNAIVMIRRLTSACVTPPTNWPDICRMAYPNWALKRFVLFLKLIIISESVMVIGDV